MDALIEVVAMPESGLEVVEVVIRVRDRGGASDGARYEAELVDYPVLRELGATPWEAVRRLVAGHRTLLERRWSTVGLWR